jgi:hypothetical protein
MFLEQVIIEDRIITKTEFKEKFGIKKLGPKSWFNALQQLYKDIATTVTVNNSLTLRQSYMINRDEVPVEDIPVAATNTNLIYNVKFVEKMTKKKRRNS